MRIAHLFEKGIELAVFTGRGWDSVPLAIPQWLVLSGISPQAVMLYCLYQVTIASRRTIESVAGIPQTHDEYAAMLKVDETQYLAAHHELLAVGAADESEEIDEEGNMTTVLTIYELSPSQWAEDEQRSQQRAERRAVGLQRPPARTTPPGNVYAIRETLSESVKIGYSAKVAQRQKGMQSNNPNPLDLLWHVPGDRDLEDALHKRFENRRIRGEWFDFDGLDPVEEISRAAKEIQEEWYRLGMKGVTTKAVL